MKTEAMIAGLMTVVLSLSVQQTNAENFMDKLNKKLEQANIKVQKNAPNQSAAKQEQPPASRQQNVSANTSNTESGSVSKSGERHSSGSGPDVLGLRIGMAPADARTIIKSRPKQPNYVENSGTLLYSLPDGIQRPVDGSRYFAGIQTSGQVPDRLSHRLYLRFNPVPGHEELIYLDRGEEISADKKPTYSAFLNTLTEKYGPPTYVDPQHPGTHIWSFDNKGVARKPGYIKQPLRCMEALQVAGTGQDWPIVAEKLVNDGWRQGTVGELIGNCGAILLRVLLNFDGNFAGPETLVNSYVTHMLGLEATARGSKVAKSIIDGARQKASSAAIKAGQQQKPDL